ncbi:hypothetical protein F5882DRAFT_390162 [Hyaloscypha sp. PMI_1271]|nr:hypothetical protein F5882DRAFT_390162 [Hyaloscypha sp. PMI_1271]
MDRASQVLVQGVPPGMPTSYRALADHSDVPRSTLHDRCRSSVVKSAPKTKIRARDDILTNLSTFTTIFGLSEAQFGSISTVSSTFTVMILSNYPV